MKQFGYTNPLDRPLIFVSGPPRSGTSLVTKVIDAHPDVAVLMENIFSNRRRHWQRAGFWNSPQTLGYEVTKVFRKLKEPIVGNKVCTPDVWSADDINMFCHLFSDFKIVFMVRDPVQTALSRLNRENLALHFNDEARRHMLLNFQSIYLTFISSWRQSIETYWKFRDRYPDKVYFIYYEDFCADFEHQAQMLCQFLGVPFSEDVINWHELPHHDANGDLKADLKYPDQKIFLKNPVEQEIPKALQEAVVTIQWQYECWQRRTL
jgi:hypothetical protein